MKDIFPLISLGNEAPLGKDSRDLIPGVIALANEARFTTAYYSEPLTGYIVGWGDNEPLKELVDYIAPPVPVAHRFEFKKTLNAQAHLVEVDDVRAIGSAFKKVEYSGETVNSKTANRGLTIRLDRDDESITEERAVALLTKRIYRGKLQRSVTVLLALSVNTNKTWGSSADPDSDMIAAAAAGQGKSGVYPNRGIIGLTAWNKRRTAYAAQETAGAMAGLSLSPEGVAGITGLESLRISRAVYQSTQAAKARFLGDYFVAFSAEDVIGKDDPSHVKQFVSGGGDTGGLRVFREEVGAKFIDITVEHYDNIVGTSDVGAEKLTIS